MKNSVRLPLCVLLAALSFAVTSSTHAAPTASVDVNITADNAYEFGYGTASAIPVSPGLLGNIENCDANNIFNCGAGPETYPNVPASTTNNYFYIVAYADNATTQGVIADVFAGSVMLHSGTANWQVYATGLNVTPGCPGGPNFPSLATINAQIAIANANGGGVGTSIGWVGPASGPGIGRLAIGELNDGPAGNFGQVCLNTAAPNGISTDARWMWYNANPGGGGNPFLAPPQGGLLIFRLSPVQGAPATSTTGIAVLGLLLLAAGGWFAWKRS